MKCFTFKRGKLYDYIPLTRRPQGGLIIKLGDSAQVRMEIVRAKNEDEMEHMFHGAPSIRTARKPKKLGNRVKFYVLKPLKVEEDGEKKNVILYFNTTHPRAEMRLMEGVVQPLVDLKAHYCESTAVTNSWRLCGKGSSMAILFNGATVRLWGRSGQPFDVTNHNGEVTCRPVPKENRKTI